MLQNGRARAWRNVLKFTLTRLLTLALMVAIAVYLTIIIANLGGYVDTIVASRIEEQVGFLMRSDWLRELPTEERFAAAEQLMESMKDAAGLNDPFLLRTLRWLGDGLTLNWGEPERARTYGHTAVGKGVGDIIADNLSRTLLVFGIANILLFVTAVLLALFLSRRYGGILDRLFILLSPISAAPAWVLGILLSTFLLRTFGFSPGGTFDTWPGDLQWGYVLVVLRHLLLPFAAVFLAGLFQSVYTWRSFFQIYRQEDYVDMAFAKGLSNGRVDRNYIVRPALPALLTSFALLLAVLWQEVIALEYFFNVRGIGRLFVQALTTYDTPMIVAVVTIFAYLIAITVFILDICYIFVDPRVRVGKQEQQARAVVQKRPRFWQRKGQLPATRGKTEDLAPSRSTFPFPRFRLDAIGTAVRRLAATTGEIVKELTQYPSAILGLIIIAFLLVISGYAVIAIPYNQAITMWRGDGNIWQRTPTSALPSWVNFFRREDLPPTFSFDSADYIQVRELDSGLRDEIIPFTFTYYYADFPQDIILDMTAQYETRGPHVSVSWVWPDGRERELTSLQPRSSESYFVNRDTRLQRRLRSELPLQALFLGEEDTAVTPQGGQYTLRVEVLHFEPDSQLQVTATILGQVHGLAGTDVQRRDLTIALLWGTPIALAFGLIAAFATSVGGMLIAALAAWYSGWLDHIVQFLTEVNLVLPFFPVSLMIFVLYSRSIITILAVTVALTIFGSAVKTYRAAFLQVRTSPYIEAARAYGASNRRIVVHYMLPRLVSVLVPRLIVLVPGYVFLEATLAFLGVTDPHLPTWGKLVVGALSYGVYSDSAHLVIGPLGLLFITGFAFAMVGLALERVFEPRLRKL